MPQLAPILWLNMFFILTTIISITTIFSYFMAHFKKPSYLILKLSYKNPIWSW